MKEFEAYNKWKYKGNKTNWQISVTPSDEDRRTLPASLFKYYALNDYSLDALENQYLYASDRWQLNDPFDCHNGFVSFDNYTNEEKNNLLKSNYGIDFIADQIQRDLKANILPKSYNKFSNTDKLKEESESNTDNWNELTKKYANRFFQAYKMEFFKEFGVISMTENSENILMWSHYAGNSGYALEFDVSTFETDIYRGPFQIAYEESFESCNYKEYGFTSFVYQTMIKSKEWSYENEWRWLALKMDNSGMNITGLGQDNLEPRQFNSPLPKSVILGPSFMEFGQILKKGPHFEITLSGHRLRLINHALKCNTPLFAIVPPELQKRNIDHNNVIELKLDMKPINLRRKVGNVFYIEI